MGALDRYDEWEAGLDDSLIPLEALYDDATLRGIESRVEPPAPIEAADPESSGWRSNVAAGAMVVGLVNGVREALDPDPDEAVAEAPQWRLSGPDEAVTVHLAWGAPAASVAIVRPWLL